MGRRKPKSILPPTRPAWDMEMLNDLSESVAHILDILYPLQYTDIDKYDTLCREMAHDNSIDYYRELKWWLPRLDTLRWELEMAQYLAQLLPDVPEITLEDIDDDTFDMLERFSGNSINPQHGLDRIIEYCNKYYK